jgi:uncharacterized protein YodC (DUF2158 family)
MNHKPIEVGAYVHLKDGGGPTMLVTLISGDEVECAWTAEDGGSVGKQRFLDRELNVVVGASEGRE